MVLIQGQQLGSHVQQVEHSVWAKYMGGPRGQKSQKGPHGSGAYGCI